jgi:catechol 2,3-dioxygenase-like lactoylglutathione lyase family enzyme
MARGLDHLVIAVRDLDRACRFYERLGFQVGARNRHPWGTVNRLVQFPGSFLELITLGEAADVVPHAPYRFSFGAFVRDYLARREGLAMLALDSESGKADAALFAAAGIGDFEPFSFERQGRRPDGSEVRLAFTLAFARNGAAPGVGFFASQQHFAENFWAPAFQQHPNKAVNLSAVAFAAPEPEQHRAFLTTFTGVRPAEPSDHDLSFALTRGRLDVMTPGDAADRYGSIEAERHEPALVAFAMRIEERDRQTAGLQAAGIPYQLIGSRLVVPASAAFGVAIAFEPA